MIELDLTEDQYNRAEKLYSFKALKDSFMQGERNIYGALGEIAVYDYFKNTKSKQILHSNTFDYDLIIDNHTFDVKTKSITVKPLDNYLCSIQAANTRQKCDGYIFCRVTKDFKKCYILGYINKKKFFENAFFKKKGEFDTSTFAFKSDAYHLAISKLVQVY